MTDEDDFDADCEEEDYDEDCDEDEDYGCTEDDDCNCMRCTGGAPFRDPGGESSLRAGELKHPCPTCRWPNKLSDADKARGYQCDGCAKAQEHGGDIVPYDDDGEDDGEDDEDDP
jgi:hypothetical protein